MLGVTKSQVGLYRAYVCKKHVGCSFVLKFGWPQRDSLFVSSNRKHMGTCRATRAKGGRCWKKRNRMVIKDVYGRVITTKSNPPQPTDMVNTAGTMLGEDISYFAAYQKLKAERCTSAAAASKAFQLIRPYLKKFETLNGGCTTHVEVDDKDRVLHVFVCPPFINQVLKCIIGKRETNIRNTLCQNANAAKSLLHNRTFIQQ